jgi:hypothetical protein
MLLRYSENLLLSKSRQLLTHHRTVPEKTGKKLATTAFKRRGFIPDKRPLALG